MKITIEAETPNDSGSLFRVFVGAKTLGEGLTAAQTHVLIGEVLEQFAFPAKAKATSAPATGRRR